MMKVSVVV